MAGRRPGTRELTGYDDDAVKRLLARDPDPEAHVKQLAALAAAAEVPAKEQVWQAMFVDHSSRPAATPSTWARRSGGPAQAELLRPYAERYLEELPPAHAAGCSSRAS